MSLLPEPFHDECPPAYGGCRCSCHSVPGVKHCMPCCWPGKDEIMKPQQERPELPQPASEVADADQ